MTKKKAHVVGALLLCISFVQALRAQPSEAPLGLDPAVRTDTLANGLVYYVRGNARPTDRAELRLVVNAGSVLEDDDQRGLAHVVEHMAFNGTEHFAHQAIVDYLESIGMRFGPDLNAYTGFDETVYMLTVPTDSADFLDTAFQIMQDWAHAITFDPDELDKERGVVIEEWRLGRGADARMREKEFPVLLHDSKYARRLPIGTLQSLQHFDRDEVVRFYHDWYRPDLMAVVAVGDFDADHVEDLIRRHFGALPAPVDPRPRPAVPVPDHDAPLVSIATDPEAAGSTVSVYYKLPSERVETVADFRRAALTNLYDGMLTQRLQDRALEPQAPFLYAYAYRSGLVRTRDAYILSAGTANGNLLTGLEALYTEAERVRRHGFTQTELERQKTDVLRLVERNYEERDKTESSSLASQYVQHFLTGSPATGITRVYELYRQLLPTVTLDELNDLASAWMTHHNQVILVRAPAKDSVSVPTADQLLAVIDRVEHVDVAPYEDVATDLPLVPALPAPGHVVDTVRFDSVGVTRWTLSNGATVYVKPTDFKDDQVLFSAQSPGGTSLASDSSYVPAVTAAAVVQESGLGAFDQIALRKRLAGKAVSVQPWISDLQEGLSGGGSPKDLETLLQLAYLSLTAPRADSNAFVAYQQRMQGFFQNRGARPESAFADTIRVTMAQHDVRERPWTPALFGEMNLRQSRAFYRDRFADASDFSFFFVGNVSPDTLRPLVDRYLAALPSTGRDETWRDVGIEPPEGVVRKVVRRGQEPKGRTQIIFHGPFAWTRPNRYALTSMTDVLEIKLRETLREAMGGTYGVSVSGSTSRDPRPRYRITISFAADPGRLAELTNAVFSQIDSLKTYGVDTSYVAKIQETQRRSFETNLEENGYWLSVLQYYDRYGGDPDDLLRYPSFVDALTSSTIQDAARRYFDLDRYVQVSLVPEDFEGEVPSQ